MVKRIGNLFDEVASFDNLTHATKKAMQGCGRTPETCDFFFHQETELLKLLEELLSGSYQPGEYRYFTIHDPKVRTIAVAPFRDRVVHHAIVRVITPIYERRFIHDSYATRKGKGTHAAIKRVQQFVRRWPCYVKADVHKYFDSIDHDILLAIVERKIKDRRLLRLLGRIVRNGAGGRGIPIGNLTSQFMGNVYFDPFDHFIKDELGIKGYVRYMDDYVFFGDSIPDLQEKQVEAERFISNELSLRLNSRSVWFNDSSHGLSFLGMRIFPRLIRVRGVNKRRSMKRIKEVRSEFQSGLLSEESYAASLTSITGHMKYFCPNLHVGA